MCPIILNFMYFLSLKGEFAIDPSKSKGIIPPRLFSGCWIPVESVLIAVGCKLCKVGIVHLENPQTNLQGNIGPGSGVDTLIDDRLWFPCVSIIQVGAVNGLMSFYATNKCSCEELWILATIPLVERSLNDSGRETRLHWKKRAPITHCYEASYLSKGQR